MNKISVPLFKKGTRKARRSEQIFGFKEIPDLTCPLIDSVIDELEKIREKKNDKKINKTIRTLEKIRTANENLRNILYDWKTLAKELLDEHRPNWRKKRQKKKENYWA